MIILSQFGERKWKEHSRERRNRTDENHCFRRLLHIPNTDLIGNDLPGFPPEFQYHNRNLDRLRQTGLDWSVMCPGTMVDSQADTSQVRLHVTTDVLPLTVPETIPELSEAEIAGYLFGRLQELDVAYEDVVNCMLNYVELAGPFQGKRVGIAYRNELPVREPGKRS